MRNSVIKFLVAAMAATCVFAGTQTAMAEDKHIEKGVEVGGFLGVHIFNDDNELGVVDRSDADSLQNAVAFGFRAGYMFNWLLSAEGELSLMPTTARESDTSVFALGYRANILFHPLQGKFQPFVLAGFGGLSGVSSDENLIENDSDAMFHLGVGGRFWAGESFGVRLDARLFLPPSSNDDFATHDWEFTAGLFKVFGKSTEAPPPPPPADTDGDGLTDDVDQCPQEPEDADGFQDDDGCPDNDNDADGVPDADDQCRDEPEDADGFQDEDGCPDLDNDSDGLADDVDKCPNEPEDKDGFEDEDGCPDLDNDGDGVADVDDKCPAQPETINQYEDADGCPDEVPIEVQKFSGAIRGIKFRLGKAKIRRSSNKILDEAITVLQKYPDVKLEIQGHTDTSGSDEVNRKLSQARADAVMAYMTTKGVDASRLTAVGYGPDKPVADNSTRAGKALNRRVEFTRQ